MASDGNGNLFFATTTNQLWGNANSAPYSQVTISGGAISGLVSNIGGINGYTYFTTSGNQLFQHSTTNFSPLTLNYTGAISQFAGSGGYMYFVTVTNLIWQNQMVQPLPKSLTLKLRCQGRRY